MREYATNDGSLAPADAVTDRWYVWFCITLVVIYVGAGLFIGLSRPLESNSALLAEAKYWESAPGFVDGRSVGEKHAQRGVKSPNSSRLDAIAQQACPATAHDSRANWFTAFKAGYRTGYKQAPAPVTSSRLVGP